MEEECELKKIADGIIFVADNYYPEEEINKIKDYINYAECYKHREYDFGSYKRGLMQAFESGVLKNAQELVMCNDSCVGPVFPFAKMFDAMDNKNKDFWGITENEDVNFDRHIQSYFMVFSSKVFNSECFVDFFKQVKKEKTFQDVVKKYEIRLTGYLNKNGFTYDSYIKSPIKESFDEYYRLKTLNPTRMPLVLTEKYKSPLIKLKALNGKFGQTVIGDTQEILKYLAKANPDLFDILNVKFSVIMPTYNRAYCMENAINSLLKNSYKSFELIIVDDGSCDETESLINKKYDKELAEGKIIYKKFDKHHGVSYARNVGIKLAKGDWIAYLDTDNYVSPDFLEMFKNAILLNPVTKCFYARFRRKYDNVVIGERFNWNKLCRKNYIDMGTFCHHKSLYDELGGFDENISRLVDWGLILRYTHKYPAYFITNIVMCYNDSDDFIRISNSESFDKARNYIMAKLEKYNKK